MKVGIIGAMEPEVAILKGRLNNLEEDKIFGINFYQGNLAGVDVVLIQSGIGKVAASVATTLLIDRFRPDYVINTGSAGGVDPSLEVGDIVISTEVRHHDVDVTAFGYEIGQVPAMPAGFGADDKLVELATSAATEVVDGQVVKGLITTGDTFMCEPEKIDAAKANFPTMKAVEMEGAAIAQSCHQLSTPFVVIRSLSDIAGKESPMSFEEYLPKASLNSSNLVEKLVERLA